MEGPLRRLLLVAGLLVALLPVPVGTFLPHQGGPCDPTLIAGQVALLCSEETPTPECCDTVLAAANSGGGVPCLCLVAAESQLVMAGLNATHLLAFYSSCGGLRPGGAHIAAACEGARSSQPQQHEHSRADPAYAATSPLAPAAADVSPSAPQPPRSGDKASHPSTHKLSPSKEEEACLAEAGTCAMNYQMKLLRPSLCMESAPAMARLLFSSCGDTKEAPSSLCCSEVLRIIDNDCLCWVGEQPEIITSILDSHHMWFLYSSCAGKTKVPEDTGTCSIISSPPPPPNSPPPPASSPPSPPSTIAQTDSSPTYSAIMELLNSIHQSLPVVAICFVAAALLLGLVAIVTAIVRRRSSATVAPLCESSASRPMESVASSSRLVAAAHRPQSNSPVSLPLPLPAHCVEMVPATPQAVGIRPALGQVLPPPSPAPSAPPEKLMSH